MRLTESALQELDETAYWMKMLVDAEIVSARKLAPLLKEVDELIAILVTCVKNAKRRGR